MSDLYLESHFATTETQCPITNEMLDKHLDAILRAGGSSLKNYPSKNNMRAALLSAMIEALEVLP